ncbi:MAG: HAMP domain-containing histidine kinase [Planctomycetes bacterium]|nr:HAMP domain-containing histidine kinase [Planctomycetota bacterium]
MGNHKIAAEPRAEALECESPHTRAEAADACHAAGAGELADLLQDAMQATPSPMLIASADERIVAVNDNFRFLFGYFAPPGAPVSLAEVVPPACLPTFREAMQATLRDGAVLDIPLPPLTGSWHEMRFVLSGTRSRRAVPQPPVILLLREVSAGIRLAKLEDKEEMQEYLFRAVVHDMRSPLGAIVNGLEFLRDLKSDFQAAERSPLAKGEWANGAGEVLDVIERSAAKIEKLLDDTQSFMATRGGRSSAARTVVSLGAVAEDVVDVYRLQELPHDLRFSAEGDTTVRIDAPRIARAIDNLLSNAVKYSPEGGGITVRVFRDAAAAQVVLEVTDGGLGIPAECLDRIWEPFFRLERDRGAGVYGSGLGLSIVRFVVDEQGGTSQVISAPGRGSTFTLRFPAHK